jgi:hypothetical protein
MEPVSVFAIPDLMLYVAKFLAPRDIVALLCVRSDVSGRGLAHSLQVSRMASRLRASRILWEPKCFDFSNSSRLAMDPSYNGTVASRLLNAFALAPTAANPCKISLGTYWGSRWPPV